MYKYIFIYTYMWGFPKIVVPQNGWFIMGNPIKTDDLGGPPFKETPIYASAPNNPQQLLCLNFTTCFNLNLRRSNSSCQRFKDQDFGMKKSRQGPFFGESWQQCLTELKQIFHSSHRNQHLFLPFSHPEPFFEVLKVFEVLVVKLCIVNVVNISWWCDQ